MIVKAVCPHDCPDTCSMLVTVEDGRATRIAGDPDHPFTNGFLCTKVAKYLERTYHSDRLLYPQIRIGAKGAGKFRRATWDAALALAIMHVIVREGLEDRAYLAEMTVGWNKLRDRVMSEYSPERAASICRLPVETIEHLARRYATTRPSFIRMNYGLQRHAGGGNAVRAISILPLLTGDWNLVGGGMQLSSGGTFGSIGPRVEREDWIRPGTRTINMTRLGEALTQTDDPPVQAMVVYNSNPASIAPDRARVLEGLKRDDLFTVVLEH